MYKLLLKILAFATLALMGCQHIVKSNQSSIAFEQFSSLQSVKDYLSANLASKGFNGKSYCAYEVLDTESDGENEKIYLWVLCQEYYRANQKLQKVTGSSFPLALIVKRKNNGFQIISYRKPRDGALYAEDMPVIFPGKIISKIQSEAIDSHNKRIQKLQDVIRQEADMS
jgi:hypothetical protein